MVVTKPVPKQNSTTKAKSKSKKKPTESVLSFFAPSSALAIKNKLKPISPKQSKLSFKSDVNGKARNKTCIVLEDEGEEEDVEAEERDSDIEIVDSTELKRMVRRRSPSSSPLIAMDTNHMVEALSSQVVIVEEGDRVEKDMFQREALLLEEEMPEEHDQSKEELNEWNDDGEEGRELEYNEDGENVEGDEDDDGWGDEEMDRNVEDGGEELAEEIRREVGMQEDVDEDEVEITEGVKRCPICSISLYSFTQTNATMHVNNCLDGKSTSFFPRLSSLFRPDASTSAIPITTAVLKPGALSKNAPLPRLSDPKPVSPKKSLRPLTTHLPPALLESNTSDAPTIPNAFSTLMKVDLEEKLWKIAEKSDNIRGRMPAGEKRSVPFYKWVDGMEVTVDAFKYGEIQGCKAYFLSHAHSDHYQNLNSSWKHGLIYCSKTTANLIKLKLQVKDEWLRVLPMDKRVEVLSGLFVTALDANHCPGSSLFLFEGPHTDPKSPHTKSPSRKFRHLHCGDFRASPAHLVHPALKGKRVDICYLDTTYLDPRYCFPAQELVMKACAELIVERVVKGEKAALYRTGGKDAEDAEKAMKGWLSSAVVKIESADVQMDTGDVKGKGKVKVEEKMASEKEKTLVVVGTYSIGKERIVKEIAQALGTKVYCNDNKLKLLMAQDDPVLHSLITRDPYEAQVHIVYLQEIKKDDLATYLQTYSTGPGAFTNLIGLRPTGWTYAGSGKKMEKNPSVERILQREGERVYSPAGMIPQKDSTKTCLGFGVPYSEHSSMFELTCFALSLDYGRMIPTVNVHTALSRKKMNFWFDKWKAEKKRRKDHHIPPIIPRSEHYW